MPIIKSAKKALRGSLRKKAVNDRRTKTLRDMEKKVLKLVAEKKKDEAKKLLPQAYAAIDKARKTGVIKMNTASRKKSRLARATK